MQAVMPLSFIESFSDWLRQTALGEWFLQFYAEQFSHLFIGEKLALGILCSVCFVGSIAASNRFFAGHFDWPSPREEIKTPRRKKGFGLKHLVLLLIAL